MNGPDVCLSPHHPQMWHGPHTSLKLWNSSMTQVSSHRLTQGFKGFASFSWVLHMACSHQAIHIHSELDSVWTSLAPYILPLHKLCIPVLWRLWLEDQKFKVTLGYKTNLRPVTKLNGRRWKEQRNRKTYHILRFEEPLKAIWKYQWFSTEIERKLCECIHNLHAGLGIWMQLCPETRRGRQIPALC